MPPDYFADSGHVTTAFKSIIISCTTSHIYYTVLHFQEEVEYIWSKKWSVGKVVYLLARYLGTFFLACTTAGIWKYAWNGTEQYFDAKEVGFFESCFYGNLFTGLGPMVILVAEVILMMRVYALYGRNKKLLAFFILLVAVLFVFNIFQMTRLFLYLEKHHCDGGACFRVIFFEGFFDTRNPSTGGCIYGTPMSGIAWAVTSFVELSLFLLVLLKTGIWDRIKTKAWDSTSHSSRAQDVTTAMAKDSVAYFSIIFSICIAAVAVVFAFEHIPLFGTVFYANFLANAYETIVITIMTILAPNLILNLRAAYYGPAEDAARHLSWNAQVPAFSTTGGRSDSVCVRDELESFVD